MSLTKYPEGSLRELWAISFPLMLASLSTMLMLFVDRLLLAHYSISAHNAAVNVTTLGWAFVCAWMVLANISEVFVAQYNGAGKLEKQGEPVWQLIWLSLGSILFFLPLSIWGGHAIYGNGPEKALERDYFHLMMLFGSSFPLYASLCGFFIGQGKTYLITILAVVANIINATLDVVLIFGVEGWIPSLGVKGAAISTSFSTILESLVLFAIFFNKTNRKKHGTHDWTIKPAAMWQCVRVGLPGGVFVALEILGFAIFYEMMTSVGEKYITIVGICQSIFILLFFFSEGISKGASTIVGNLIGAKRFWLVPKVILAGFRLHLLFFAIMLVCFIFGSDLVIAQFLPQVSPEFLASIYHSLITCLLLITVYIFFEGIRFLLGGVLTAAGDTLFLLVAGTLSVWILMVLPVYLIIVRGGASVEIATGICAFSSIATGLIYFLRVLKGKWHGIVISNELLPQK
jgi:multidrug resistance protein, MATE family